MFLVLAAAGMPAQFAVAFNMPPEHAFIFLFGCNPAIRNSS